MLNTLISAVDFCFPLISLIAFDCDFSPTDSTDFHRMVAELVEVLSPTDNTDFHRTVAEFVEAILVETHRRIDHLVCLSLLFS